MYSRYSSIQIPKNYGGSRFAPSSEPSTKVHRGVSYGAAKNALSPSFAEAISAERLDEKEAFSDTSAQILPFSEVIEDKAESQDFEEYSEGFFEDDSFTEENEYGDGTYNAEYGETYGDISAEPIYEESTYGDTASTEEISPVSTKEILSLRSLFSHIDKDELIILGLILLLISDDCKDNNDIVTVLALILLSGKL